MAGDLGTTEVAIVAREGRISDEVEQLNVVTHRYGDKVVIAEWDDAYEEIIRGSAPAVTILAEGDDFEVPVELGETERLGLEAFRLRGSTEYIASLAERPLDGMPWDAEGMPRLGVLAPDAPTDTDTETALPPLSERLTGSVAVATVFVQGPASDNCTFTPEEQMTIVAAMQNGLTWLGAQCQLTKIHWDNIIRSVTIEAAPNPNLPPGDLEAVWLLPTMEELGYPRSDGLKIFVRRVRRLARTHWAYCAFFIKYPSQYDAWAKIGGPYCALRYPLTNHEPLGVDRIIAHETGHIFGAGDEYLSSSCTCDEKFGYFQVPNYNCVKCADTAVPCIMNANTFATCPYTPWQMGVDAVTEVGDKQTASTPFVVSTVIFFESATEGHEGELWRVNADGSNPQYLGYETGASPFVANGMVFFQNATDGALHRVNVDGTNFQRVGANWTPSSPFVAGNIVYFQGTDGSLWRVKPDGSEAKKLAEKGVMSAPFVAGQYAFFAGLGNRLYRVNTDGTGLMPLSKRSSTSSPFVADGVVYFQGMYDELMRVDITGENEAQIASNKATSTPCVGDGVVYFQEADNELWCVKPNGKDEYRIADRHTVSTPFYAAGRLYFQEGNPT